MMDEQRSELLTTREAAHRLGVSRRTIQHWIERGILPAQRGRKQYLLHPDDLAPAQVVAHVGRVVPAWRADPVRAGARLRALREATGRSQLDLAAISGVSHEIISWLERGRYAASAESVRRLAQALGVPPERFVSTEPIGMRLLSAAQAAAELGVPPGRVQVWLKQGWVPGTKVSGQWRVPAMVVRELARSGRLRGHSRRLDPRYHG